MKTDKPIVRCGKCGDGDGVWVMDGIESNIAHRAEYMKGLAGTVRRKAVCGASIPNLVKAEHIMQRYGKKWA
jgi:hypothetical protein